MSETVVAKLAPFTSPGGPILRFLSCRVLPPLGTATGLSEPSVPRTQSRETVEVDVSFTAEVQSTDVLAPSRTSTVSSTGRAPPCERSRSA